MDLFILIGHSKTLIRFYLSVHELQTVQASGDGFAVFDCADCAHRMAEALRDTIAKTGSSI